MVRKVVFVAIAVPLLGFVLLFAGRGSLLADPGALQNFDVDIILCLGGADPFDPAAITPSAPAPVPLSCGTEDKNTSAPHPTTITATALNYGTRLAYPYNYTGPGWKVKVSEQHGNPDSCEAGEACDGTQAGGVVSAIDLFCDEKTDVMASPSGVGTAEDYTVRTTDWDETSGPPDIGSSVGAPNETFLDDIMPPPILMDRVVRWRADITKIWLGGTTGYILPTVTALNVVTLEPAWSPKSPTPTRASLTTLAGGASAPARSLTCLDSPQASISTTSNTVAENPDDPGLYARWISEISAADAYDSSAHAVYTTACKAIGGTYADVDADCSVDGSEGETCNAYGKQDDPDADGDLLLDGIEVAWGTDPCESDTDGDGRTDFEEMIGPTQMLTAPVNWQVTTLAEDLTVGETDIDVNDATDINVGHTIIIGTDEMDVTDKTDNTLTVAAWTGSTHATDDPVLIKADDTDGDGVTDGGYILDEDGDGVPDFKDQDADATADTSMPTYCETGSEPGICIFDTEADGSSHVRVGAKIVTRSLNGSHTTAEGDNCPNLPNASQTNTDRADMADGDHLGDVCDGDDDADGIVDDVDGGPVTIYWDASDEKCTTKADTNLAINSTNFDADMSSLDPDEDGDGYISGVECLLGSNPGDADDIPAFGAPGKDGDGLDLASEQYFRTQNFSDPATSPPTEDVDADGPSGCDSSGPGGSPQCGLLDWDSDGDGLNDSCEAAILGSSPINPDSDYDGITDPNDGRAVGRAGPLLIGNGEGMAGDDPTNPASGLAGCDFDSDDDGLTDADEVVAPGSNLTACFLAGGPDVSTDVTTDVTYDDDSDKFMLGAGDDGTSWDTDGDGARDGVECSQGTDPTVASPLHLTQCLTTAGSADVDSDGLAADAEVCKWGTSDGDTDSDDDGLGDCTEVMDIDGDGSFTFAGDLISLADVYFAGIGEDVGLDNDGDNSITFAGDLLDMADAYFTGPCV